MAKHIIRASLLSVVIVFSMLTSFTQGMNYCKSNDIQMKNIQTEKATNYVVKAEVGKTCYCPGRWMLKVEGVNQKSEYEQIVAGFKRQIDQ